MLFRINLARFLAVLFVSGVVFGLSVPAIGADKDKSDKKEDKDKKDKKADKAEKEDKAKPGEKVLLKWKFEKDKSFYQTMTTKTVQNMKVMNNDVNQTQNQTFYFKWTPIEVKDDKVKIDQTIIGVKMDIEIGGSKINYDSTKEGAANNPLADFFKALVGSKFTITLDLKDYKVTSMDGRDAFLAKLVAANPQMKPLLDTILSQEALKEMAEPIFAVVPTKEVAKGDKWTKTTRLDMGPIGKYENTYAYTFSGPEGTGDKQEEVIKVETTLNYTAPADVAGQGGLPFKIKGAKLTSKNPVGLIKFNAKKGRVDYTTTKLDLSGELSIEIGGQATKVTLSQNQESTVETSDDNPTEKKK